MNFILDNWYIFILIAAIVVVGIFYVKKFLKLSREQQIAKVKEWLLIAVAQAQQVLGDGTGQLKLRYVYDNFITKFPGVAKFISFEYFSILVDEALTKFNDILANNPKIKTFIKEQE